MATKAKPIALPNEGVNPPTFARIMSAHLETNDPKRMRAFLRATFADEHQLHSSWPLTRAQMIALLARFGNERARAYAAKARTK